MASTGFKFLKVSRSILARLLPRTPVGELTVLPRLLADGEGAHSDGEGVTASPQEPNPRLSPLTLAASSPKHYHENKS